jgi:hypothetical protein
MTLEFCPPAGEKDDALQEAFSDARSRWRRHRYGVRMCNNQHDVRCIGRKGASTRCASAAERNGWRRPRLVIRPCELSAEGVGSPQSLGELLAVSPRF